MPLRSVVTKNSGEGEQITIEVTQCNVVSGDENHTDADFYRMLDTTKTYLDSRTLEMNTRMLEAYGLDSHFDLPTWQKIIAIFDILAGRQSAAQVVQRWNAAIEENETLAKGRGEVAVATNGAVDG